MSYKVRSSPRSPARNLALPDRDTIAANCRKGRHEIVEAPRGYVTYLAGDTIPEGTRYCRHCWKIFPV